MHVIVPEITIVGNRTVISQSLCMEHVSRHSTCVCSSENPSQHYLCCGNYELLSAAQRTLLNTIYVVEIMNSYLQLREPFSTLSMLWKL